MIIYKKESYFNHYFLHFKHEKHTLKHFEVKWRLVYIP